MENKKSLLIIIILLGLLGGFLITQYFIKNQAVIKITNKPSDNAIDFNFESTRLAVIPNDYKVGLGNFGEPKYVNGVEFSPDGRRVAFSISSAVSEGVGEFVIIDGKEEKMYSRIYNLTFSPDSKHLAYSAAVGADVVKLPNKSILYPKGQSFIVLDGVENNFYKQAWLPVFSPNSQHLAYAAEGGIFEKCFLVLDGQKQKLSFRRNHQKIYEIFFSPDSNHIAYRVKGGRFSFSLESYPHDTLVVDGKQYHYGDAIIDKFVFSPDGKHFAYIVNDEGLGLKQQIILDGKPFKKYDENKWFPISYPAFNAQGNKLAYALKRSQQYLIVIDGKEVKELEQQFTGELLLHRSAFSPDLEHFACAGDDIEQSVNEKAFMTIDGIQQGNNYSSVTSPVFSHNGEHLAYIATKYDNDFKKHLVIDGEESGNAFDAIYTAPIFSPDDKYIMYGARKGYELWWIVESI